MVFKGYTDFFVYDSICISFIVGYMGDGGDVLFLLGVHVLEQAIIVGDGWLVKDSVIVFGSN